MSLNNKLLATLIISGSIIYSGCTATNKVIKKSLKENDKKEQIQKRTINTYEFTLDNGLKLYINKNPLEPRFNAKVIVKAGSKNDPKNATGTANFIEHMLFKGTENIGALNYKREKNLIKQIKLLYDLRYSEKDPKKKKLYQNQINAITVQASQYSSIGEFREIYESLGAKKLNAKTFKDYTEYSVDLPKNHLEQWAKIESDRFLRPVFRGFQIEIEEIHQEKNFQLDHSGRLLASELQKNLYKKHPYKNDILGKSEDILNPSLSKTLEFFDRYYIPNNSAIVISGDLDVTDTKNIINKYFGKWQKKVLPKTNKIIEPEIENIVKTKINHKGLKAQIIGFRLPNKNSPDRYALELIDNLLSTSNKHGLIKKNLVETQKLINAGSSFKLREDHGEIAIYAILNENQSFEYSQNLLIEQIEKIKKGDFSNDMLKAIVFHLQNERALKFEKNDSINKNLERAFIDNISIKEVLKHLNNLQKINKEEIVRVANKYFKNNYVIVNKINVDNKLPKIDIKKLEAIKLNLDKKSNFYKEIDRMEIKLIEPKWIDYKKDIHVSSYAPGINYYHVNNPLNNIFDLKIEYEYGDKNYHDMCILINDINYSGTKNFNNEEIKAKLFNLGVDIDFSCNNNNSAINISGNEKNLEEGLKIAEELFWQANIKQKLLDKKIKNIISLRKTEKEHIDTLIEATFWYLFDKNRSPFLNRSKESNLKNLSKFDYKIIIDQLKKQQFKIKYTGKSSPEKVKKLLKKYHQPKGISFPLLENYNNLKYNFKSPHDKNLKFYIIDSPKVETYIVSLATGEEVKGEDELVNDIYNEYFSQIMYEEIIESRGLSPFIKHEYRQGERKGDTSLMIGVMVTQPEKAIESINIYEKILRKPPKSINHFEASKKLIENNYRASSINFRNRLDIIDRWYKHGYLSDPREEKLKDLENIEFDDINDYIQKRITSEPITFVIVGDKSKLNLKELSLIGKVEEISKDELFTD